MYIEFFAADDDIRNPDEDEDFPEGYGLDDEEFEEMSDTENEQ